MGIWNLTDISLSSSSYHFHILINWRFSTCSSSSGLADHLHPAGQKTRAWFLSTTKLPRNLSVKEKFVSWKFPTLQGTGGAQPSGYLVAPGCCTFRYLPLDTHLSPSCPSRSQMHISGHFHFKSFKVLHVYWALLSCIDNHCKDKLRSGAATRLHAWQGSADSFQLCTTNTSPSPSFERCSLLNDRIIVTS